MRKWTWSLVVVLMLGSLAVSAIAAAAPADSPFAGKWTQAAVDGTDPVMTLRAGKEGAFTVTYKDAGEVSCGIDPRDGTYYGVTGRGEAMLSASGTELVIDILDLKCPKRAGALPATWGGTCWYDASTDTLTQCQGTWARLR